MLRVVTEFDRHFSQRGYQINKSVSIKSVADMDFEDGKFPEKELNRNN